MSVVVRDGRNRCPSITRLRCRKHVDCQNLTGVAPVDVELDILLQLLVSHCDLVIAAAHLFR